MHARDIHAEGGGLAELRRLVRFEGELCDTAELTLPHPGLRDRTFWASQLAELETDG